eukprot:TRINITY_DN3234_c0_g1_i4.p1 TRINITY_DN3234_c0_g1~~TRINITY_DN3234_c0_g1_i4.p1  ORF type:complete len:366 (+),score=35.17 TRINITY_DN3234_c0_g1_i4:87-1184(+)
MSRVGRLACNTILMLVGSAVVAISVYLNFVVALIGILFIGVVSSWGESLILGYLKLFPASMTGAWSSGTGAAGLGGTLFYLGASTILQAFSRDPRVINKWIFLLMLPSALFYWLSFKAITRYAKVLAQASVDSEQHLLDGQSSAHASLLSHSQHDVEGEPSLRGGSVVPRVSLTTPVADLEPGEDLSKTEHSGKPNWALYWHCTKLVLSPATQLAVVYFLEYVVSVGFASKANPRKDDGTWFEVNAYAILAFCYQLGVLISRSSISIIQIRRIEILTMLQAVNFVIWLIHALHFFMPFWFQFIAMIYVGLLGGAMYLNTFYFMMMDTNIPDSLREKCINIVSLFINFGIISSAFFEILASATFLK